jgi:triphosphoribosyl-dephospho-CoA synthase
VPMHSHGRNVRRLYGAGGARLEAAQGFPSVYEIGLPARQSGAIMAPGDAEAARVQACFAFLDGGGVGRPDLRERAHAVHRAFVARRFSPGGSADLLAMSHFVQACEAPSP